MGCPESVANTRGCDLRQATDKACTRQAKLYTAMIKSSFRNSGTPTILPTGCCSPDLQHSHSIVGMVADLHLVFKNTKKKLSP